MATGLGEGGRGKISAGYEHGLSYAERGYMNQEGK